MDWVKVLDKEIDLKVMTKILPSRGNLAYEYNPLRNYRLAKNMYEYKDAYYDLYGLYKNYGILIDVENGIAKHIYSYDTTSGSRSYVALSDSEIDEKYTLVDNDTLVSELIYCYEGTYNSSRDAFEDAIIECRCQNWQEGTVPSTETSPVLHEKGELVDFITDELNFSLNYPVSIVPQYSYDGSVNLILNDGLNYPRLINTRFSATGKNTYEIVDRRGDNDTNIYDQGDQFNIDTSLFKLTTKIVKLAFGGVVAGGNLPIGIYHFYFKLADADGNETDFVAESGLVSVFIGQGAAESVTTGVADENSCKMVRFYMTNIDASYDYVKIYFSRDTAQPNQNYEPNYGMYDKKFLVDNSCSCNILITGSEEVIDVSPADINLQFNYIDAAKTATTCQDMLLLANVHKPEIPYEELSDLSLRFLPYVKEVVYPLEMDENYNISSSCLGYYDPEYIYSSVGYWNEEYYRIGIVYIMYNNELSPVFNIRGRYGVKVFGTTVNIDDEDSLFYGNNVNDGQYNCYKVWNNNDDGTSERVHISINEETYYTLNPENDEGECAIDRSYYENAKGVITFSATHDTNIVYALDIRVDDDTISELKKYVKGFFFVRQKRIPTVLCQGITLGIDTNAHTPTIPTCGGFLEELADVLDESTYVEVDDINGVNYISEGFMSRYQFKLQKKKTSIWKIIGMAIAAVAILAVCAVATVLTCGAAGVAIGVVATALTSGAATTVEMGTLAFVATIGAMALGGAIVAGVVVGAVEESVVGIIRATETKELKGRYTEIPVGYERKEIDESRLLVQDFLERVIIADPKYNSIQCVICPEFESNQPYYNQIFTGNKHIVRTTISQSINRLMGYSSDFFTNNSNQLRHFYIPSYYDVSDKKQFQCKLQGVPDDSPTVGINSYKFKSRAGSAEEAWRYSAVMREWDGDDKKINAEIIRGSFGAYLAITGYPNYPCDTIEIMIPGYEDLTVADAVQIRIDDDSYYSAITDRFAMDSMDDNLLIPLNSVTGFEDRSCGYQWDVYRGDCYICQFSHRINRNFNDPSAPYNDEIVDEETWKKNYNPDKTEKYEDINLGDVNAIELGMWVTFRVRCSTNLNIRTIDNSQIDERMMCGHGRGYYPYLPMNVDGNFKTAESEVYNDGFRNSLSERYNFTLADVPYIKNWFGTRIMYSDIHVNDAFKNGYRNFRGTNYIDCTREYGEITKIVNMGGNLLVVFEHGVGMVSVTPGNIQKNFEQGNEYLNVNNVLSAPAMISDCIGSQWADSVLATNGSDGNGMTVVYGVDTVAKKIWAVSGSRLMILSDQIVQEFLNNNITLGERELEPIIGIRNVKTFYNAFKKDVMFTFYDNLSGFEERVWNLCFSEVLNSFITFYSWVPSYMENINNIPFSFNRNTSKWIAKLGVSHAENSFADGITLTNNIMENWWGESDEAREGKSNGTSSTTFKAEIITQSTAELDTVDLEPNEDGECNATHWAVTDMGYKDRLVGILGLTGVNLPSGQDIIYKVDYLLERDNFLNFKYFEIKEIGYYTHQYNNVAATSSDKASINNVKIPVYGLYLKEGVTVETLATEMYYRNIAGNNYADWETNKVKVGDVIEGQPLTLETIINDNLPIYKNRAGKRITLERNDMVNATHIVRLLNIKAVIYGYYGGMEQSVEEYFYNYARENASSDKEESATQEVQVVDNTTGESTGGQWVDCGYYESVVAVIPRWNIQFLSTDFWKHGQAGLIDIADKIYPAYWYGEQHPFEFEFIACGGADRTSQYSKIFTNIEIISNNVKPESFHYEIVGDMYDFSKDKKNIYFRQEAMKALYQYNGADLLYNSNFLEIQPEQCKVSTDLPHRYYAREDTFNDIYDSYKGMNSKTKDYDHLTGAEIVYYENLGEYRIWAHQKAVSLDDFGGDSTFKHKEDGEYIYEEDAWEDARSLIAGNCRYTEDKWEVSINPVVICYKNEYNLIDKPGYLGKSNSTWTSPNRPPLPVMNGPIPPDENGEDVLTGKTITNEDIPECLTSIGYTVNDLDPYSWLDDVDVHGYSWGGDGTACNREEIDVRGNFVKIRIRYTGNELAVISFINTIYQISIN